MRTLIMGAGAVGGYFGARLQSSGNDVFFCARGDHLQSMRENGLQVRSVSGDMNLKVQASDQPGVFGVMDLIIISVKAYDTDTVLELIRDNVGPDTVIMSIQNGVENEERVSKAYGWKRTLGGVAYIGVKVSSPGVISHEAIGRLAIGNVIPQSEVLHSGTEFQGPDDEIIRSIYQMIRDAGIPVRLFDDIMPRKWAKLAWNAAFNPVSVITGLTTHAMVNRKELRPTLEGIIKEVVSVANAAGCHLDAEAMIGRTFDLTRDIKNVKTSMLQDFESGKPLEIDALTGAVVRKGRQFGIPTPINTAILGLVSAIQR